MRYHRLMTLSRAILISYLLSVLVASDAAVSCDQNSLSTQYLSTLYKVQISNFIPSVYYNGESSKFVTTEPGVTTLDHPSMCVDGGATHSGEIQLYDDGSNGDDVANDGVYSRNCVHFCSDYVDFSDMFGFAMAEDLYGQKLIVLDPAHKGKVPYKEMDTPLTPGAKAYASSHAFFFADVNKKYFPNFPNPDGGQALSPNAGASPTGKSVAVSALLQVFGDVFDFVTLTPLEGRFNGGIYKWQNWDRRGGAQPFADIGEVDACSMAVSGVQINRLVGGITMPHLAEGVEFQAQIHELVHGIAGYEFNNNLEAARTGDGMHVPGACTMDHSSMQGPIWDWVKGYPNGIERPDGRPGGLRLEANRSECDACPDNNLANCCSFRYLNRPWAKAETLANPELAIMSPLMLYIAGLIEYKDIPADQRTYYCMGSDTDGGCGSESFHEKPCTVKVDDSDTSRVTSDVVTRATLYELVTANGGRRFPTKKFHTIRHANIILSARIPSEAEITFHTLFWRFIETMTEPWERTTDRWGNEKQPMESWTFETDGLSVLHSRLHGIECGEDTLSTPSCSAGDNSVCAGQPCGPGALCQNFDGKPLCICREGLVGDGYECAFPSETANYELLPSAHDLGSTGQSNCFPDQNIWTNFINESALPPYPGGQIPYAPTSCFNFGVCGVGWRCNKTKGCLPPRSRRMCQGKKSQGLNKGQCLALGCCRWTKQGRCRKKQANTCPRVEDPNDSSKIECDDPNTCCYFSCDRLELSGDGTTLHQRGNCGKGCTATIAPDYRGIKFAELHMFKGGYWTNEEYYEYTNTDGPMKVSGSNKDMFERCKYACYDAPPPPENPGAKFLWKYIQNTDDVKTKSCLWLSKRPDAQKRKLCVKKTLSARGFTPPSDVCYQTCEPYV